MPKSMRRFLTYGATVVAIALPMTFALAGPASAASLTSSDGTVTLNTTGTVTAGPYSSGQTINISVIANTTMNNASLAAAGFPSGAVAIKALECADPNGDLGDLPTKPTECQPDTILSISGAAADGSMNFTGYTVYALPDTVTFGEPSNGTPVCGAAPNYCVIGLFSNQSDFSKPHIFSAPFQVTANADDGGENPGDGTPEVPYAIGLPLAAVAIGGGTLFLRRRKQRAA